MLVQDLARHLEELVDAREGRLLVAMLAGKWLRGDASEQLDVKVPRSVAVRVLWRPLHLEELEVKLERIKPPVGKPVTPFHLCTALFPKRPKSRKGAGLGPQNYASQKEVLSEISH